jgi:RNA polymerase sigma-70 factor (ECF subfamily)
MATNESFNALLIAIMPKLRAYAMYLTRNRAAADDLLQETAYRALRARDQFAIGTNFTGWIFRILRNEFISTLRRNKGTVLSIDELPEGLFSAEAQQEDFVFSHQVIRAMDQIHPAQRQVLELVCGSGLTYQEAATVIDCSVGTIKSRVWRARKHMSLLLNGSEYPRKRSSAEVSDFSGQAQPHVAA